MGMYFSDFHDRLLTRENITFFIFTSFFADHVKEEIKKLFIFTAVFWGEKIQLIFPSTLERG